MSNAVVRATNLCLRDTRMKTTPLMIVAAFGMKRVSTIFTISISEQALPLLTMLAGHSQEIKTAAVEWQMTPQQHMAEKIQIEKLMPRCSFQFCWAQLPHLAHC